MATLVRQRDMFRQLFEQLSGRHGGSGGAAAQGAAPAVNGHAGSAPPANQQAKPRSCSVPVILLSNTL